MPASLRFPLTTLSTVIIIIIIGSNRPDWSAVKVDGDKSWTELYVRINTYTHTYSAHTHETQNRYDTSYHHNLRYHILRILLCHHLCNYIIKYGKIIVPWTISTWSPLFVDVSYVWICIICTKKLLACKSTYAEYMC